MFMETSSGEHNAFINLNRNYTYMYKDTSYLGSKLPQVTFSKKNKYCSFRLMEQKKNKTPACSIQGYKVRKKKGNCLLQNFLKRF